jgi:death on curing protein
LTATEEFCQDLERAIIRAHDRTIVTEGGLAGLRDSGLLTSSVRRPWISAFGEEPYAHPFEKAAAIAHSIISNHPFIDGNKRTASIAMRFVLLGFDYQLHNNLAARVDLLVGVADGRNNLESIRAYIEHYAVEI